MAIRVMADENAQPSSSSNGNNPLRLGNRKKPHSSDALVHHGRHFGRTVYAMCNVRSLITNGLLRLEELDGDEIPEESLASEARAEYKIFQKLQAMVPNLLDRVVESEAALANVAELIQKGISSARSDDAKSLKGVVVDWITPRDGVLQPVLSRNVKTNRGFHHPVTGALLCPAGLDWNIPELREKLKNNEIAVAGDEWPVLLYADCKYDPEEPWDGLFRNKLLVWAFKHIFNSPSSVEKEVKATRSGNARIHGMTQVTVASLAYVATQLRFALSSASVFGRSDTSTDSERFYVSTLEFFEDPEEKAEVDELLNWWNCQVFPSYVKRTQGVTKQSALAKLKEKRLALVHRTNVSS